MLIVYTGGKDKSGMDCLLKVEEKKWHAEICASCDHQPTALSREFRANLQ